MTGIGVNCRIVCVIPSSYNTFLAQGFMYVVYALGCTSKNMEPISQAALCSLIDMKLLQDEGLYVWAKYRKKIVMRLWAIGL